MTNTNMRLFAASALAITIVLGGCGIASAENAMKAIPQPDVGTLGVAPDSARVDLKLPNFSNPTNVTNPLFPVSKQESILLAGTVDNKPFRTEVTLMPYTRIIAWEGIQIETLVSQYVAFLDGRIQEVAYDLYAQADDGSVWYFGEDVNDFKDGVIFTKEGTWLVTRDGPPAMIMPGKPKVGDVFRAENMPGIAFEEVTITAVGQTIDGPLGPITGTLQGNELHMDDKTISAKIFGPGYGEVLTRDADLEALVLAVPTDALSGAMPGELTQLTNAALEAFTAAGSKDWKATATILKTMVAAWEKVQANPVPKPVITRLSAALAELDSALSKKNAKKARHAAIEAARWSYDLQLRYRPVIDINLARLDLWAAQILVDAEAKDAGSVKGDVFTLTYIADRLKLHLDPVARNKINLLLGDLQPAASDEEFSAAAEAAGKLRELVTGLAPKM